METTWKPQLAGWLNLIGGIPMLILSLLVFSSSVVCTIDSYPYFHGDNGFSSFSGAIATMLISLIAVLVYLFVILSGIYTLQRKKWEWAVIGSFLALSFILGIISLVLVYSSKDEFI
jgi:uncharacterized BrkB/YihY/UPF0761 family membrane protein